MRFRASHMAALAVVTAVTTCASCSGTKQDVADLTDVVASPATFEGMTVTVRGMVSGAGSDETESRDGEKASFVLVPPSSQLGMAVMGADPPEIGGYAEATGTVEIDPQLNSPYMSRPSVRRVSELPMWKRPFDRQTLAALAALCAVALAVMVFTIGRRYRGSGREPSEAAFRAALASILVPTPEPALAALEPPAQAEVPPQVMAEPPATEAAPAVEVPAPRVEQPFEPEPASLEVGVATEPEPSPPAPPAALVEAAVAPAPSSPPAPAEPGGLVVEVRGGVDAGRRFALDRSLLTIGRHPDRDVILTDPVLGEWDATIVHSKDGLVVRAEGEHALLSVNGQPTVESVIGPHDVIRVGSSELVVRRSGQAPTTGEGGLGWLGL